MDKTAEIVEEELIKEIEKSRSILDGLSNNESYRMLVDDFKKAAEEIDSVWHLHSDINKLNELRITKFAANTLINALDSYKHTLDKAIQRLEVLRNAE